MSELISQLLQDLPGVSPPAFRRSQIQDNKGKYPKTRVIHAPNESMRALHQRLVVLLRSNGVDATVMRYAHGSMPGRSVNTNAQVHLGSRYFYATDISNAFPS